MEYERKVYEREPNSSFKVMKIQSQSETETHWTAEWIDNEWF